MTAAYERDGYIIAIIGEEPTPEADLRAVGIDPTTQPAYLVPPEALVGDVLADWR